jgi:hypothetical protein
VAELLERERQLEVLNECLPARDVPDRWAGAEAVRLGLVQQR